MVKQEGMPKKTRKEKIIAEYRKKLRLLENNNIIEKPKIATISSISPAPIKTQKQKSTLLETDSTVTRYFLQDLKKSLLLIGSIIALEILLYFVTISNYLKLGK